MLQGERKRERSNTKRNIILTIFFKLGVETKKPFDLIDSTYSYDQILFVALASVFLIDIKDSSMEDLNYLLVIILIAKSQLNKE